MPARNPVTSVYLDPAIRNILLAMAKKEGRSLSNFIAQHMIAVANKGKKP
jgi:molybdopterin-guanine dinucleotide biosynthesis protein A